MATYRIVGSGLSAAAEFVLDADECRGIAAALGLHDAGAAEMLAAAEDIEARMGGDF